ncbi:hypothetical protein ACTWP4_12630 [Gracilibacillus sp. D59]|uniref:hypothetical protein n=1 Tax=Gracilibacillus sp. D59 TaxID=3457434 RepID=UPI003FCDDCE3
MENQIVVMKNIVELSETMVEGLQHLQSEVENGNLDETMYLFEDFIQAFASIENAMNSMDDELKGDITEVKMDNVKENIEHVVQGYEKNDQNLLLENMQHHLEPTLLEWKKQMEKQFHPYILN